MVRRPRRALHREEQGVTSVIAMVILFPLLFLFILLAVQATVAYRTNQVAAHAAQEGARLARTRNGSDALGRAQAWKILNALSPGTVLDPHVDVRRNSDTVRVEVRGRAYSVVPWLHPPIKQVSEGKVEKFRGPDSP